MLKIVLQKSLKGNYKNENQDAFLVKKLGEDYLLAVADGMGGGVMGKELAQKAIEILDEKFTTTVEYPLSKLKKSILDINTNLREMLKLDDGSYLKGGTTLAIVYYSKSTINYVNIGDSRVWICKDNNPFNLTIDQNLYEEKRLNGLNGEEDDKRLICKILGRYSNASLEETLNNPIWRATGKYTLEKSDLLILSTDGYHDYTNNEICDFSEESFNWVVENSKDNITIIVAKEEE